MEPTADRTDASMSPENTAEARRKANRRRFKQQTSCTLCRAKKLKCDRKQPCKNCEKRSAGSCIYIQSANGSRVQRPTQETPSLISGSVQDRVRRLERLIISLAQKNEGVEFDGSGQLGNLEKIIEQKSADDAQNEAASAFGHLQVNDSETRFITPSHWESLIGNITELKDAVEETRKRNTRTTIAQKSNGHVGPELLFAGRQSISKAELICSLPCRQECDRLVSTFVKDPELPLVMIHVPTFLSECEAFWRNPQDVSLAWLSILFSILNLSLLSLGRAGETDGLLMPEEACQVYISRSVQCLVLSDYTIPKKYTLEALMLYLGCEHYRTPLRDFSNSLIHSLLIRLAYRAGYHKDPAHYPRMSIFEAEMRRRVWGTLVEIDYVFASSCGVPRAIDFRQTDTLPPTNAPDEDLNPEMTLPPKERPETERTWVVYMNYKNRILGVLGSVLDNLNSSRELTYEDVLELDKKITREESLKPAWLALPEDDEPIKSIPFTLYRLVILDITVQRARMVLHRKYLDPAYQEDRYIYSRQAAVRAALQALSNQRRLHDILDDGKNLASCKWRLSTFTSHDFLLAAMLVFIATQELLKGSDSEETYKSIEENIKLLEKSFLIWLEAINYNQDAQTAARVLEVLLQKLKAQQKSRQRSTSACTTSPNLSAGYDDQSHSNDEYNSPFADGALLQQPFSSYAANAGCGYAFEPTAMESSLDVEDMLKDITDFDWIGWDSHFQSMLI